LELNNQGFDRILFMRALSNIYKAFYEECYLSINHPEDKFHE